MAREFGSFERERITESLRDDISVPCHRNTVAERPSPGVTRVEREGRPAPAKFMLLFRLMLNVVECSIIKWCLVVGHLRVPRWIISKGWDYFAYISSLNIEIRHVKNDSNKSERIAKRHNT